MSKKTIEKTVNFSGATCLLRIGEYQNGGISLQLIDQEDGMPYLTATAWIPNLQDDEFAIKNYAENVGIYEALIEAKIIQPFHRTEFSGFIKLLICRFSIFDF